MRELVQPDAKLYRQIDDEQWHTRSLYTAWCLIPMIVAIETVLFLIQRSTQPGVSTFGAYLQAVLPSMLLNIGIMGVAQLLMHTMVKQSLYTPRPYILVTAVSLMCLNAVWTNRLVYTSYVVFMLPMILSLIYMMPKVQWYAFLLNLLQYVLFIVMLLEGVPSRRPEPLGGCTTISLILIAHCLSLLVIYRQQELVRHVINANRLCMLDSFTQLYNHAAFFEHLDGYIIRHVQDDIPFTLILFDIDDFKHINDNFGHETGDTVILELVATIELLLPEEDLAYRYGGEEFTVLTLCGAQKALVLADNIRIHFAQRANSICKDHAPTVSAGVCEYQKGLHNGKREFFASADEALYHAKRTGKNKAILWTHRIAESLSPATPHVQVV